MTQDKTEVNIADTKTSKYETMLTLVTVGYVGASVLVFVDGLMFILDSTKVPTIVDGVIGTAWVSWTAGLFGWLLGKNGKD